MSDAWEQIAAGDEDARSAMTVQYLPLVRYVAGRMRLSLPPSLDFEDIVGYGTLGLMEAIDRFDPDRGFKFATFAIQRIRGSILDELRTLDWAPRRVRSRMRNLERAAVALNGRLQRDPSSSELAEELGIDESEVDRILREAADTFTTSLDETLPGEDASPVSDIVAAPDSPQDDLSMRENLEMISRGIEALDCNARALMALYYFEGLTFTQIGALLGVTESWACQVHADAIRKMRASASF